MKSAAIAVTTALLLTMTVHGQSSPAPSRSDDFVRDQFREAHAAREKHAYDDAEKLYRRALDYALHLRNPETEFQASFYLGLTKQEAADEALLLGDKDQARKLLGQAQDFYEKAHQLKPNSTSTLLNLAEVAEDNDDRVSAKNWLERGLGFDDDRAAQFAERLGDLEVKEKDPKDALKSYRLALKKKTASASLPHKYFTQLLVASKEPNDKYASEAVDQLWTLWQEGDVDQALDGAFAALKSGPAFSGAEGVEMLNVIAAALAEKEYDEEAFTASKTSAELRKLSTDPALGPRIAALFSLYDGTASYENASTWLTLADHERPSDRPSGVESLQNILRSRGFAAQRARKYALAESAYNLSLRLDPGRLDPGTLRDLATVYYAQGKLTALGDLLHDFEQRLYEAKSAAYEHVDWAEVYEYHRTIGMLDLWTGGYENAKLQFNSAAGAAERLGTPIDPELRLALADAYAGLGNDREAMSRQRLLAAEQYVAEGDLIRARGAVSGINTADVQSEDDIKRYRMILDSAVRIAEPLENLYDVKSALAILSTAPEKPLRVGTEKLLEQWGVTNVRVENERGTFAYEKRIVSFEFPAEPMDDRLFRK
jgi:tetratricopeptide (TPR) repeat protein